MGAGLTGAARAPYVPPVRSLQSITLRALRFHALAGILPHEQEFPQPLEIDVTVWLDGSAPGVSAGVDYRELYDAIAGAVRERPIGYLEDLVQRAATSVMALRSVARVRIAARKPHVSLPGPLAYAEVVVEQDRDA